MKTINDIKKNYIKKEFLIENLMKPQGLYCLVARPKVGKSLLALQIANSIATGTTFLGLKTSPSPTLYISTEMDSFQLYERIEKMKLEFNDRNLFIIDQEFDKRKLNLMDLEIKFKEFSEDFSGRLVIMDMLCGIEMTTTYDLNSYQDIGQNVFPKLRELCKKYNFTILFIHHLNKNNTSLGSTAIDGSVDGKITLKLDNNLKNKILFNYESRDFENFDLILKRNVNLIFEISEYETEDLNPNLQVFLNYAIKQKDFSFTSSEMTSKLNLTVTPSVFGKLLNNNLEILQKEGLHIELKKTSTERIYFAKYEEPIIEND